MSIDSEHVEVPVPDDDVNRLYFYLYITLLSLSLSLTRSFFCLYCSQSSGNDSSGEDDVKDSPPAAPVEGCSHYPRRCKIRGPCCDTFYSCRFCHDEACFDHEIDRFDSFCFHFF